MTGWLLRKCRACGEYTFNQSNCPKCGGEVHMPHPPKFSIEDKYARYRRAIKEEKVSEGSFHKRNEGTP
ncbi:MAG: RNA-protein complex protein Nop10 [Candidatus Bathyarchaeota archaeon]